MSNQNQPPGQGSRPPQQRPPQNQNSTSNTTKFLVIGLVVFFAVIPVFGCLAALAIPSFLTYMNRAKVAEADAVTQEISDQVLRHYDEECQFPPSLPATGNTGDCCGGSECRYDPDVLGQWEDAGLTVPQDSGYLVYETEDVYEKGGEPSYEIRAVADFGCNDAPNHTFTIEVHAQSDTCQAEAMPGYTEYEFE